MTVAFGASQIVFPIGVRLSTLVAAAAFVALAAVRRDKTPLIAGWVWLVTFEAAFQIVSVVLDRLPLGPANPVFWLSVAAVTVFSTRRRVRPDVRFLAAAALVGAIWVATGFHLNANEPGHGLFTFHEHILGFDWRAEVLNELAKMLWAAAYFLPLARPLPQSTPEAESDET
ncbi:MAG TPA: hypothetical protein VGH79_05660 [Gaiellaceae bacterium]|jgi:hypothetical protein